MGPDRLRALIAASTREDWDVLDRPLPPGPRSATFRHEARVELRWGLREEPEGWDAPWWARFADPEVRIEYLDVLLRGRHVDRVVLARVDAGRGIVPEPLHREGRWLVSHWEAEAARLVNELEELEGFPAYLAETGITVVAEL